MKKVLLAVCAVATFSTAGFSASLLGIDPPSSLIVTRAGLEWVYASPCDPGGCSTITLHHGFRHATGGEWTASFTGITDLYDAFTSPAVLCAAAYFDNRYNHCDESNITDGYVYNAPFATFPNSGYGETFLVREMTAAPEPTTITLVGAAIASLAARKRRSRS